MRISNFREPLRAVKISCVICPEAVVPRCYSFRCSWNFRKTYRKKSVLESLSIKLLAYRLELYLRRGCSKYFPVNLAEFLRAPFFTDISWRLLLPVIFCLGGGTLLRKTVFSAKCNFSETEKWMIKETNSV